MSDFCSKCNGEIKRKNVPYGVGKAFDGEFEAYIAVFECPCGYSNESDGVQY